MKNTVFNTIIARISDGDISAAESIYNEYYKKLQIVAVRILKNIPAAEDAASQTILDLIEDAQNGKIGKVKYVSGYLCTISKNIALKMKERDKAFIELTDDNVTETPDLIDGIIGKSDLTRAIFELKDTEKEIGLMFYIYGYKIREIAVELNMPSGTVKWHIRNIKKKIKLHS